VRVVASKPALEYVRERGGGLYVWKRSTRCCHGGFESLVSSTKPKRGADFRLADDDDGLAVYVPTTLRDLPEELHVELRRYPWRRIEAYWDDCAWVF
jgi:hypothetical protein